MPRFAVVDVETSGLSSRRHRILQIGLVTVDADGTVVDQWSTLVHLQWPWSRVGPRRVHGITRRTLRGAPRTAVALKELRRRLDGNVFTAHNADFDAAFIERSAARSSLAMPLGPRLCTLQLSRRLDPDRQLAHGLADVTARYGVTIERHHDALCDARATAAVLPHLLAAHGVVDAADLEDLYVSRRAGGRGPSRAPGRVPVGDEPRPAGGLVSGP
jgi:DNA polymerase-3 subunit epsilon